MVGVSKGWGGAGKATASAGSPCGGRPGSEVRSDPCNITGWDEALCAASTRCSPCEMNFCLC